MGRKSAHSGMSPKDRSINLMDKFIQRNDRRNKDNPILPSIRKDAAIPIKPFTMLYVALCSCIL